MTNKRLIIKCLFLITLLISSVSLSAEATPDAGKALFKAQCAACHNKNMKDALTGPALGGVEDRWADYPQEDLYKWIRNSQSMIVSGHPKATELWREFKPVVMTPFTNLKDEEISSILLFIKGVNEGTYGVSKNNVAGSTVIKQETSNLTYYIVFGLLALLSLILSSIVSNLSYVNDLESGIKNAHKSTWFEKLKSKAFIRFVTFLIILFGGHYVVSSAMSLGRSQGYQPEQPIKFSHKTHAGDQKIDCKFCHDGARRSKHSVIPSTNTCMSCHKAIKSGSNYGTAELTKIYASIGFDPNKDMYIKDYNEMDMDDIEDMFKKWIGDQYMSENDMSALDAKGEGVVKRQWKGIVSSLTNEYKDHVGGPIEWIKIHNLPDHVYYSHKQHVNAGKIDCNQCHGKVEEMDVVRQYSTLSMGWCVNCHRETEVQFEGNEYYESYEKFHEELKSGKRDRVTVEDIGGTECQKCHY